jgi:predicted nucleotidyltransferase
MDVRSYVDGYVRRESRRLQACEEQRARALKAAKDASALLADAGATKVVLFGSLGCGREFDFHSDIDLAVEGISWSEYWRLWSAVDALTDIPVDLVMQEDASPSLAKRIDLEGVVLYEKSEHRPVTPAEG